MANPFFSGRIPQDLLDRVEQHVKETGQSKTDVLINALAAYLNHPVTRLNPTSTSSFDEERLKSLENRVATLEALSNKHPDNIVIKSDNEQNLAQELKVITSTDKLNEAVQRTNVFDNNSDNKELSYETLKDLWAIPVDNVTDNNGDNNEGLEHPQGEATKLLSEHTPEKFESLTSSELIKTCGLKQSQLDSYKRRVSVKFQKMEQPLEKKQMLSPPEKLETKNPTTINGYPYDLFYLGENEKGNSLWSAIPYDNSRYRQLSIE